MEDKMQPTCNDDFKPFETGLAVSLELASGSWKMAMSDGKRDNPTIKTVSSALALERLEQAIDEIEKVKAKWGLARDVRTVVLYEAGQDGFWIARELMARGYEAVICDPASIPVERHARRAKTDRLDAIKLVRTLLAWLRGERERMRAIRIPAPAAEDQRQLSRDRGELQKEALQHRDRMRKLLRTVGCWDSVDGDIGTRMAAGQLRCYDGSPLPPNLLERLNRECKRLAGVEEQFHTLEKSLMGQLGEPERERIMALQRLKAVGAVGATRLVLELFWRKFKNRREVGASLGLVPQPYNSGVSEADQGISKQANRRVRSLSIEMAWFWLRYQPDSAISRWYAQRMLGAGQSKRHKRIAIVAVARRLIIALWRYLEHGVVPEGAVLKAEKPGRTVMPSVAAA